MMKNVERGVNIVGGINNLVVHKKLKNKIKELENQTRFNQFRTNIVNYSQINWQNKIAVLERELNILKYYHNNLRVRHNLLLKFFIRQSKEINSLKREVKDKNGQF